MTSMQTETWVDRIRARRARSRAGQAAPQLSGGLPRVGHTVIFDTSAIGLLRKTHKALGEVAAFSIAK